MIKRKVVIVTMRQNSQTTQQGLRVGCLLVADWCSAYNPLPQYIPSTIASFADLGWHFFFVLYLYRTPPRPRPPPPPSPLQGPVNLKRLVWNAKKMFQIKPYGESDMSPTYVIRRVRELCEGLSVVTGEDSLSIEAQRNATMLFKILVSVCGCVCFCLFLFVAAVACCSVMEGVC